jgi:hypothetical protein
MQFYCDFAIKILHGANEIAVKETADYKSEEKCK